MKNFGNTKTDWKLQIDLGVTLWLSKNTFLKSVDKEIAKRLKILFGENHVFNEILSVKAIDHDISKISAQIMQLL